MATGQQAALKRTMAPGSNQSRHASTIKTVFRRPTPDDLIELAARRFRSGKYANIEQLADELGIARATAYKWIGNGDRLLSQVLGVIAQQMFEQADAATGARGATRICAILMSISRQTLALKPFRQLLESAPEKTLRVVASKSGLVQKTAIASLEGVLKQEMESGNLRLPLDSHTMAYVLIRLCESFLYADTIAGESIDLPKLEITIQALLGQKPTARRAAKQSRA